MIFELFSRPKIFFLQQGEGGGPTSPLLRAMGSRPPCPLLPAHSIPCPWVLIWVLKNSVRPLYGLFCQVGKLSVWIHLAQCPGGTRGWVILGQGDIPPPPGLLRILAVADLPGEDFRVIRIPWTPHDGLQSERRVALRRLACIRREVPMLLASRTGSLVCTLQWQRGCDSPPTQLVQYLVAFVSVWDLATPDIKNSSW